MQKLVNYHQKTASDVSMKIGIISQKVDTIYHDLNNILDSLSAHFDKLDTQLAQIIDVIKTLQ